jgi:hypothetical protein
LVQNLYSGEKMASNLLKRKVWLAGMGSNHESGRRPPAYNVGWIKAMPQAGALAF